MESVAINRSLFTLAKCVEAIGQNHSRIPYRESKMTRILSLGQNDGLTIMILNLAPTRSFHLDTLSSLNFANRTKKIEVREVENEPIFKGCARPLVSGSSDAIKRQPLRAITNTSHNLIAGAAKAASGQPQKPKAFAVYSDKSRASAGSRKTRSPLVAHVAASSHATVQHPPKRRSFHSQLNRDRGALSKAAIEDLIERKVADALAARAMEHAPTTVEPEISQEVQRRLDAIEQKIEGQKGSGREEGLSFLLCAKQHAVRGEHRSALKMYLLAKDFFPDNPKLDEKIGKLRKRLEQSASSEEAIDQAPAKAISHLRKRAAHSDDEDYEDKGHDAHSYADDSGRESYAAPKRKKPRAAAVLDSQSIGPPSPGTQRLLDLICSRDVSQISQLRGIGPKKAMGIVMALNECSNGPILSLAQLAQLKGVGIRTVENMRAGIEVGVSG